MKQSDDPKAFFEKYKFTLSSTLKHPVYGEDIHFDGLEADYVGRIQSDLEHYKKLALDVMLNNERLTSREYFRMKDEIEKLKREAMINLNTREEKL